VEIISLPWRNYASHLMDNLRFRLPVSNVIANEVKQSPHLQKFDILIQDELNHPSLLFANRKQHPCPIVSLVHHLRCSELRPKWQNDFYRVVEKKYLQNVDGFIFNSKTTQGVVSGLIGNDTPGIVAYPPTDRFGEAISESEIRERAKSNELRILFLGNVIYRKGLHTLLEALSRAGQDGVLPYKLEVVGGLNAEPKYSKQIQAFISKNHLSAFVFLHGPLDNQPLIEMYRQAHVMVVPSSYEGFGIVYLEGMRFGLPAIGTTAGAASEIITHGEDGYLIEPDDAATLANLLNELARNRELLLRLSLNAVRRYKSQPRWEETASKIREFLSVIARGDSPEEISALSGIASSGRASSSQRQDET